MVSPTEPSCGYSAWNLIGSAVPAILLSNMRFLSPAIILTFLVAVPDSDAQVKKRNGLFGFGRDEEQISAGLFPTEAPPQSTAPVYQSPERTDDGIFRGGQPSDVEAVSYVIEGGQKVEKEVPEKRNFFAFGRRGEERKPEAALLTPVPEPNYTQPTESSEPLATPVADPITEPRLMQEIPDEAIAQPVEEEKKSGGFFSFFSRKKDKDPEPMEEAPVVANPVPVVAEPAPVAEPTPVAETPEPEAKPTMVEVPSVPEFADNGKPEKEKKERDGILPPLPKIKVPKKPTNYENVETIIEDGEIVEESDSIADAAIVTSGPDGDEPPKIVDGVKTYSSWDDVSESSSSAADKILQKIR